MASVVYQCPTTGQNVQAWFDDDTPADDSLTYVSLRCPACARIHLVNRTGKTGFDHKDVRGTLSTMEAGGRARKPATSASRLSRDVCNLEQTGELTLG